MAQTCLNKEATGYSSCFGFYGRRLLANKYDCGLRRPLSVNPEEPNAVEFRAMIGRTIVSALKKQFRIENNGKFVAVAYTGRVLAVCGNLEELNQKIAGMQLKENYYIERLGHSTITQI
jgi:hypothetical protein